MKKFAVKYLVSNIKTISESELKTIQLIDLPETVKEEFGRIYNDADLEELKMIYNRYINVLHYHVDEGIDYSEILNHYIRELEKKRVSKISIMKDDYFIHCIDKFGLIVVFYIELNVFENKTTVVVDYHNSDYVCHYEFSYNKIKKRIYKDKKLTLYYSVKCGDFYSVYLFTNIELFENRNRLTKNGHTSLYLYNGKLYTKEQIEENKINVYEDSNAENVDAISSLYQSVKRYTNLCDKKKYIPKSITKPTYRYILDDIDHDDDEDNKILESELQQKKNLHSKTIIKISDFGGCTNDFLFDFYSALLDRINFSKEKSMLHKFIFR